MEARPHNIDGKVVDPKRAVSLYNKLYSSFTKTIVTKSSGPS